MAALAHYPKSWDGFMNDLEEYKKPISFDQIKVPTLILHAYIMQSLLQAMEAVLDLYIITTFTFRASHTPILSRFSSRLMDHLVTGGWRQLLMEISIGFMKRNCHSKMAGDGPLMVQKSLTGSCKLKTLSGFLW